jgi:WD40 repeat protein
VQIWDVNTGKLLRGIDHHQGQFVFGLAFSPDGKTIASGSSNLIVLSDVASGKELARFEAKMRTVDGLTFTPDGKALLSWGEDGDVRI